MGIRHLLTELLYEVFRRVTGRELFIGDAACIPLACPRFGIAQDATAVAFCAGPMGVMMDKAR